MISQEYLAFKNFIFTALGSMREQSPSAAAYLLAHLAWDDEDESVHFTGDKSKFTFLADGETIFYLPADPPDEN